LRDLVGFAQITQTPRTTAAHRVVVPAEQLGECLGIARLRSANEIGVVVEISE
jgi:hypothetical protein